MYKTITLRRGLNLSLQGSVESNAPCVPVKAGKVAVVPDDYPGFTPKVAVKPGEKVVAGQPLLIDKLHPEIALVSPVDGTVEDVVRGDRRKILRVTVSADTKNGTLTDSADIRTALPVKETMMKSGVWALMRQLPYDIVPDPDVRPRDIFITAFDSAPLATSLVDRIKDRSTYIAPALKALLELTDGTIYIGVDKQAASSGIFKTEMEAADRIVVAEINGKHPAGLASVQASAMAPVNKGETVWLLDIETLVRIGEVVTSGRADWRTTVAVTGSEINQPCMVETVVGADMADILSGRLKDSDHHQRIISGNVLTGISTGKEGFLRYPYRQVTVIPEGDDVDEFMGWASLSPNKMSENRSFLSKIFGKKRFTPDARINGGRRAMIMSGEYEKVMPMDIMPEYLVKAILAHDIDRMEALGIYEVTPADFALCEYIDPSKLELQKIVREGLDYLRKELS